MPCGACAACEAAASRRMPLAHLIGTAIGRSIKAVRHFCFSLLLCLLSMLDAVQFRSAEGEVILPICLPLIFLHLYLSFVTSRFLALQHKDF